MAFQALDDVRAVLGVDVPAAVVDGVGHGADELGDARPELGGQDAEGGLRRVGVAVSGQVGGVVLDGVCMRAATRRSASSVS
ncbi:hypothetical protein ACQEU6_31440 [Spirillospora sp. CA-108201]